MEVSVDVAAELPYRTSAAEDAASGDAIEEALAVSGVVTVGVVDVAAVAAVTSAKATV
jgi:hypothetical protein